MPENTIPAAGYLEITFPDSKFAPTLSSTTVNNCYAWDLSKATTLKYIGDKAANVIKGTLSGSAPTFYCTWASALSGNTPYGVHLAAAASTVTAG